MPRCLMAKKWKAYPWPDRVEEPTVEVEDEEEIDVVGDSPAALAASKQTVTATCWGPSSPTAGATAPSPPPHSPEATRGSTILYNGKFKLPKSLPHRNISCNDVSNLLRRTFNPK